MILRIASHRAWAKVQRIAPAAVALYDFGFQYGGTFLEVSEEEGAAARKISGVTKARDQDRANYGKCWK